MKIVIACEPKDIPRIKRIYRFMTRVKGEFPHIFDAHLIDSQCKSNKKYPKNLINKVVKCLDEYDIVIVPISDKIITSIYEDDRIDTFYIYEK